MRALVLAVVVGSTALAEERRPVSLVEALALVDQRSWDLKAARAASEQVAAKARLVYSAVLPEVSVGASYVRTTAEQKFDFASFAPAFQGAIGSAIAGTGAAYGLPSMADPAVVAAVGQAYSDELVRQNQPTVLVARDSVYGTALVQQVLFSPAFWLVPAAGEASEAAKLGAAEAREQVLAQAARLYLTVEGLTGLEQAAREAEAVAGRREKDARAQARAGVATEVAILRAQAETAQARSTLASLEGQRQAVLAMLEALAGEPVEPVAGTPTELAVAPADEADRPWEGTFQLRSAQWGLRSQERFNTHDRLSWLPTVVAQAKGSYNSNRGFAGTNFIFDAIVAAEWTLYDRGQRYATRRENDARTAELRARLEADRARARATWQGARSNLTAAQLALSEAQAQATLAARAQRQVEAAFLAGVSTSLEVADLDSRRFLAASAAANARAQVEIRKVELAAAEGRLAEVLGLPVFTATR